MNGSPIFLNLFFLWGNNMGIALVIVNTVDEAYIKAVKNMLSNRSVRNDLWVTCSHVVEAELKKKGLEITCVSINRSRWELKKIREFSEPLVKQNPFYDTTLPGTELTCGEVLFHDRYLQLASFPNSLPQNDVIASLAFDLLVAPVDVHDRLAQFAVRLAKQRGVSVIGVQNGFLRTKENLESLLAYDMLYVDSFYDSMFLQQNHGVKSNVIVLKDYVEREKNVTDIAQNLPVLRDKFRLELDIRHDTVVITLLFSIRHIWELRSFLNEIIKNKNQIEENEKNIALLIHFEGDKEKEEWGTLFKKENDIINLYTIGPDVDLLKLLSISDMVFSFRLNTLVELGGQLGISSFVYDPFGFNETCKLCASSNINILENTDVNLNGLVNQYEKI